MLQSTDCTNELTGILMRTESRLSDVASSTLCFVLLVHLPIAYIRFSLSSKFIPILDSSINALIELTSVTLLTFMLFYILRLSKCIYVWFMPLLFSIGMASTYYILNFGKHFDIGVLQDILSVEWDLTQDYFSYKLIIFVCIGVLIGISVSRLSLELSKTVTISLISLCVLVVSLDGIRNGFYTSRIASQAYMPFSVIYSVELYLKKYGPFKRQVNKKIDISQKYQFNFEQSKQQEPLVIVMMIGESMRGDKFAINGKSQYDNAPNLLQIENLYSFQDARSSATSTKISLPYMLTRANPPNFEQSTTEMGIISVFKHLGFKTAWIGAQGLFNSIDSAYGSLALEADEVIIESDLRRNSSQKNVYDSYLLPHLDEFLRQNKGRNLFIVLHMIGSHWHFKARYPAEFAKFQPECLAYSPRECTKQELENSYSNTLFFSDYTISQVIKRLEARNSFLMFASDHGYSLLESELFGNAYEGPLYIKEQYNIAMFAYASKIFLQNYGENYNNLRTSQIAVSHNHLFHSLLGCVNVISSAIDSKLNLCNANTKHSR